MADNKKAKPEDEVANAQAGTEATANINPDVLNFGEIIGNNVERKLKFKPRPEYQNLCKGRLVNVSVQEAKADANDKNGLPSSWEYAGLMIPSLKLTFIQEPIPSDPAERVYEEYLSPFTNVKKTGEAIKRSDIINYYTEEYKKLRHIANAFVTNANYNATLAVPEFNPLLVNPIERLASIKAYYEYWVQLFGGKDGKGFSTQTVWIKLVASPEGTYLKFPGFVNEGFIEKVIDGRQPTIELKPSETVELVKKKEGAGKSTKSSGSSTAAASQEPVSDEVAALIAKYSQG